MWLNNVVDSEPFWSAQCARFYLLRDKRKRVVRHSGLNASLFPRIPRPPANTAPLALSAPFFQLGGETRSGRLIVVVFAD